MRFIERQLQGAVNKLVNWTNENGFSFSASKTKCVHFCRKRGLHLEPEIHFAGSTIQTVKEMNYLGILFDSKLTFLPHVINLRKKCERSINILKVLSNTSWGADRISLLRIYRAVIRSKLDYGCIVYGSARKTVLQKLNTVHNLALRLVSGAFRTSPVESLYADNLEASLHSRRDVLSLHYYFRISSHPDHPFHNLSTDPFYTRLYFSHPNFIPPYHHRIKNLLLCFNLGDINILVAEPPKPPWDNCSFTFLNPFKSFYKDSTADIIYQQLFYSHRNSFSSYIPVFTDGSKSGDFVSCAYIIGDKTYNYTLHPSLSIFSAEVLAIFKALECIAYMTKNSFIIYSDSMSVLTSLSSPNHQSHPLVFKILTLYSRLTSSGFDILFCWVPAHVGIPGNERADKAAKDATARLPFPIPLCDVKKYVKVLALVKWQEFWDKQPENKLHSVKPVIKNWLSPTSRKHCITLTRLRIGHTRFTHRHLLLGEPAPRCQKCNTVMNVRHILVECPTFRNQRLYYFNSNSITMTDLLGEHPNKNLLPFLKDIGFYVYI